MFFYHILNVPIMLAKEINNYEIYSNISTVCVTVKTVVKGTITHSTLSC